MPSEQLELCVKQVQALNEKASIITTPWDEISGEAVLKVMEQQDSMEMQLLAEARHAKDAAEHEHEHHHHEHEEEGHEHHHHGQEEGHHEEHEHHHEHEEGHHHHEHEEGHEGHHHEHEEGHGHHHHHADEIFTSWGKETPHKYEKAVIENALKALCETEDYGDILRAKGMVESTDGSWIYFDMVPGEYELRTGQPEYTGRLCVIGCNLAEDKLLELFEIA